MSKSNLSWERSAQSNKIDEDMNMPCKENETNSVCKMVKTAKEKFDEDEGEWENCPLFMEGLPTDFATNPALAAIASLLDEEEVKGTINCKKRLSVQPVPGGGKLSNRSSKSRKSSAYRNKPYNVLKSKNTSVGEAQLFLNMWKI